jgi:hypothetical protein
MSPVRRSVQPSADHSDRNGADQLHPNRLTLLPRTKDFLDSIVYSPGHDLSHGTDAALSRVVVPPITPVCLRAPHIRSAASGRADDSVAEVTDERN